MIYNTRGGSANRQLSFRKDDVYILLGFTISSSSDRKIYKINQQVNFCLRNCELYVKKYVQRVINTSDNDKVAGSTSNCIATPLLKKRESI